MQNAGGRGMEEDLMENIRHISRDESVERTAVRKCGILRVSKNTTIIMTAAERFKLRSTGLRCGRLQRPKMHLTSVQLNHKHATAFGRAFPADGRQQRWVDSFIAGMKTLAKRGKGVETPPDRGEWPGMKRKRPDTNV